MAQPSSSVSYRASVAEMQRKLTADSAVAALSDQLLALERALEFELTQSRSSETVGELQTRISNLRSTITSLTGFR
jgi:hypothetical protein